MKSRIKIYRGDITTLKVDAIVNAANSTLLGGGGVDGAIHRAAGPQLLKECSFFGGCPTGEARITKGYNLPVKWVIHTVGPVWGGGTSKEAMLLTECYRNSLFFVETHNIKTIAFPCISTGVYHFPKEQACKIAFQAVLDYLEVNTLPEQVFFVCFGKDDFDLYSAEMLRLNQLG
ncbi:MAG: O-acetyl-ADP-ribose deacetylase [Lentisphaerae bacterium RIFOXYA12_FULL_48_11]|nr:MAG: O-acetyl-ADP-ribose deacetylase [Lentisphaerae bacterium RIFOXYA12_FULL_48_11]